MPPRIEHIFEDGTEKKRCSKCRQYLPLDNFIYKEDRWDKLHNECIKCATIRNRRRVNPDYDIPDNLLDIEDVKNYINKGGNISEVK